MNKLSRIVKPGPGNTLIGENGEITKLIAIDTDITKLKDIQFEVQQKKEEI